MNLQQKLTTMQLRWIAHGCADRHLAPLALAFRVKACFFWRPADLALESYIAESLQGLKIRDLARPVVCLGCQGKLLMLDARVCLGCYATLCGPCTAARHHLCRCGGKIY